MTNTGDLMAAEMAEQPTVLSALASRLPYITVQLRELAGDSIPGVAFLGRGSSDNAALFARYAIGLSAGLPTVLIAPSLITAFGATPRGFSGWLVIAYSQSGSTPEIIEVASALQRTGAKLVAITNTDDSPLGAAADLTILLRAGAEKAVPATKTVSAQMLVGMALAAALSEDSELPQAAAAVPHAVTAILSNTAPMVQLASRLAKVRRLAVIGRGFTYPAALETALKLQETTGLMAHGFSTSDFRHGPIRVLGADSPVVALAGSLPSDDDTRELAASAASRGVPSYLLGTSSEAAGAWPALGTLAEGILATVRGQQLALFLSRGLGLDPDRPDGLQKITLTY
jgi:glucosamine--fructose-6-phosphate aminotransferase (isomerizing)